MDPLSLFPLARGLPAPWEVVDVAFDPKSGWIDCHLAFALEIRSLRVFRPFHWTLASSGVIADF